MEGATVAVKVSDQTWECHRQD